MKAIKVFLSVALFVGSSSLQAQNVGIGQSNPNAPLQFANDLRNRKIVLYDAANNDHQFYGLGVNSGVFRYHVDAVNAAHVFFAATGLNSSNELFRIQGNGNVGIGMADAVARLQFRNEINSRMIVLNESVRNPHNFFGFGINEFTMRYQIADPLQSHVFFAGNAANATGSNELFRIRGNGNVGIGFSNPERPLSFPPLLGKKISLYPSSVGDAGFSVWGNELRIHSDNPNAAITFGVDAYNAPQFTERMRITGAGNVGIGNGNPTAPLQFATDTRNRKIVLWSVADNDHQFYGFGVNAFTQRYQVAGITDDHVFYAGNGANASNELFRIRGNGALAVNGNSGLPGQVLTSNGATASPIWSAAPGAYNEAYQASDLGPLSSSETIVDIPGMVANFTLPTPAKVVLQIRTNFAFNFCIACPPNQTDFVLQRVVSGGTENTFVLRHATPAVANFSTRSTFTSGPLIVYLPAGTHTYKVAVRNIGPGVVFVPIVESSGLRPGVLTWQIFPN